ncbi:hypothetical protein [Jeotgalibacillus soli]|uniref:Uncharacterized protein n=1 Tax=Jeotgalibacillus soli TaxID=889306 RepID=A0A0C2S2J0_9BACL|nr:hypothetical protein [Jeotgalibacillus soli]KIL48234.1 hypothetical protein KP78_16810 [Jeotgalibacillus soli]
MADDKRIKETIAEDDTAFLEILHTHKIALYKTALAYLKNEEEALEAI